MDYGATAAAASKALRQVGQRMTLTRSTEPTFDPVTGGPTGAATVQTWQPWGIMTTYNSMDRLAAANRDGSMIQTGDMKAVMEVLPGCVPQPGDRLTANGATWQIIAVDPVAPAGVPVIFKCQVRR